MARAAAYDRDAALDTALSLFWDKGYHATSLKDLETGLKMKPGSIYAAFSSKENLYLLAMARYFETARVMLERQLLHSPSPLDALADHLRSYARLSQGDANRQACMLTKSLVDTRSTDPAIAGQAKDYLFQIREIFSAAFDRAKKLGELPQSADQDRLARRFQANVTALRFELHQNASSQSIENLAEDMAQEIEHLRTGT
ncbi:TetR/AcrR family transcriptional regulator [Pseudophaeobacter sp.]|uniref:TetR/AcrR family transcriptional regulator n=1 Tax=Pseudophaeobacter sp. TaxID=1971739 RepID=UPI00329718B9